MPPRSGSILAMAAVISSFCLYASFAQVDRPVTSGAIVEETPGEPKFTDGAIVPGAPLRVQQELPGRYQMQAALSAGGSLTVALVDTHTGQCWIHEGRQWRDLGSPVKQESSTVR